MSSLLQPLLGLIRLGMILIRNRALSFIPGWARTITSSCDKKRFNSICFLSSHLVVYFCFVNKPNYGVYLPRMILLLFWSELSGGFACGVVENMITYSQSGWVDRPEGRGRGAVLWLSTRSFTPHSWLHLVLRTLQAPVRWASLHPVRPMSYDCNWWPLETPLLWSVLETHEKKNTLSLSRISDAECYSYLNLVGNSPTRETRLETIQFWRDHKVGHVRQWSFRKSRNENICYFWEVEEDLD